MSRADTWMPLYVADYAKDTLHLTTEQHGAYILLIMASWTRGGSLPSDSAQLAGIARLPPVAWKRMAPVILALFRTDDDGGLYHKRVRAEHEKASRMAETSRQNGQRGGRPKSQSKPEENPAGFSQGTQEETPAWVARPSPSPPPSEVDVQADACPSASHSKPERGRRLPKEWSPSESEVEFANGEGLTNQEVDRAACEFRDYWCSRSGKDATKLDWSGTWRNRIRQVADRKRERGERLAARPAYSGGHGQGVADFASILSRRRAGGEA